MSTDTKKYYTLKSSDKESFEVEESVAMMSQTLKNIIEDGCSDDGIPLPNVNSKILAMVVEYCKKHAEESSKTTEVDSNVIIAANNNNNNNNNNSNGLRDWDSDFLKVDKDTLFNLILAANHLNIKGLLDLTCQAVADMIKNMSVEEARKTFNIMNDFTPEEEAEVRKENEWVFE